MAVPGTMGKILMVDLKNQTISVETPSDDIYLRYFGGYGLGAYYLYKLQKPGVDAFDVIRATFPRVRISATRSARFAIACTSAW